MTLPYSSAVRNVTREPVIKTWTDQSRSWQIVKTTHLTSEDCDHVCKYKPCAKNGTR